MVRIKKYCAYFFEAQATENFVPALISMCMGNKVINRSTSNSFFCTEKELKGCYPSWKQYSECLMLSYEKKQLLFDIPSRYAHVHR